jgi:hypothetical protein
LIAGPTVPNTLETFVPTERIDAMAATAINEAISVYSITVAPWVFFMRRRKKDSIGLSGAIHKRGSRPSDGAVTGRNVLNTESNVNENIKDDL